MVIHEMDDAMRPGEDPAAQAGQCEDHGLSGFPTDMQPQIAVCMSLANGTSIVTESIYDTRFRYTAELNRMGAHIQVEGKGRRHPTASRSSTAARCGPATCGPARHGDRGPLGPGYHHH